MVRFNRIVPVGGSTQDLIRGLVVALIVGLGFDRTGLTDLQVLERFRLTVEFDPMIDDVVIVYRGSLTPVRVSVTSERFLAWIGNFGTVLDQTIILLLTGDALIESMFDVARGNEFVDLYGIFVRIQGTILRMLL